jgi:hypothetical protein
MTSTSSNNNCFSSRYLKNLTVRGSQGLGRKRRGIETAHEDQSFEKLPTLQGGMFSSISDNNDNSEPD